MLQQLFIRHRACIAGLILVIVLVASLPALADDTPGAASVRSVPIVLDDSPDGTPATAIPDWNGGNTTLAALNVGDAIGDLGKPGGLVIGQGRPKTVKTPDMSKAPGRLAAAGLLMIPLDKTLEGIIPRTHGDALANGFSSLGSGGVLLAALGGLYATGDSYDKETAKLALAALANSTLMTQGLKMVTGRVRPLFGGGHTSFDIGEGLDKGYSSFPSGHTSAAFAVATVMANRRPKQKWLYYGLATAVGLSRIRNSDHFTSDVLVGAAIGIQSGNNAIRGGPRFLSIKF